MHSDLAKTVLDLGLTSNEVTTAPTVDDIPDTKLDDVFRQILWLVEESGLVAEAGVDLPDLLDELGQPVRFAFEREEGEEEAPWEFFVVRPEDTVPCPNRQAWHSDTSPCLPIFSYTSVIDESPDVQRKALRRLPDLLRRIVDGVNKRSLDW